VGFVDSLIAHGVEADFHVKQLLARVDLQMRRLIEGSPQVAERLLRDALFFVAKSQTLDGRAAEVRESLGLDRYLPGRGLLDPEALARMRPLLEAMQAGLKAARDNWHAYVEGQAEQLVQFQGQLTRMQPQAQAFENSGLPALLNELAAVADAAGQRDGEVREQMNLEVASTLLFIQNAIEHEDVLHADFAERAAGQQARLNALLEGREMPAAVMVDANQRDAERDMLVQMAQEVSLNLRKMEEALDAFFRDDEARTGLAELPVLSQQAQGALTMLELPDAAGLLAAATATVQPFASEGFPDAETRQRLADAFSSLGIYVESYCAGRVDAANILRPVLIDFGLLDPDAALENGLGDTVESGLPARKADVQADYLEWRDQPDADTKKKFLDGLTELSRDADLIDDTTLKNQTRGALDASREVTEPPQELDAAIEAMTGLALPARAAAPADTAMTLDWAEAAPEAAAEPLDFDNAPVADSEAQAFEASGLSLLDETAPVLAEAGDHAQLESPAAEPAAAEPGQAELAVAAADDAQLTTMPEDAEPELVEIFLEEANEVLAAMGDACEQCKSRPDDQESLTVIRRGFHTLKDSGRMVSLNDLGETGWRFEQLMNGWLAEKKPASSDLLRLIERARGVFQDWVNALQANQVIALPVPALLAALERVARGDALDAVPVMAVEAVPEQDNLETESVAEAAAEASETVAESEPVVERETDTETDWMEPTVSADEPAVEYDAAPTIDFVAESTEAAGIETPAEEVPQPPVECAPEFVAIVEVAAQLEVEAAVEAAVPAPVLDVGAIIEYAVAPVAVVVEVAEPEPQEAVAELPPDEICIGTVCISSGLHEVFMTESRQRLEMLQSEVERHADMANSAVSEQARRAIHTLGGIAGTAGITPLAELSHALELYWNRFAHAPLPVAHLPLVQDTVARLHDMFASVERLQLPESAGDLIAVLGELEDEQAMPEAVAFESAVIEPAEEAGTAYAETPVEAVPEAEMAHEAVAPQAGPQESGHGEVVAGVLDVSALIPDLKLAAPAPVFERREVTDELDEQLLPIFLEEADTLVPEASAQLRAWHAAPGEASVRNALQRTLHTIKGSARMVGAMRLGELTHVMESRVIAVMEGHLSASTEVFETLEAQVDRLAEAVERLKRGELTVLNEEEAAEPLAAPIEPVLAPAEGAPVAASAVQADPLAIAQPVTRDSNALTLRVRADWIDRLVNQAGEVAIARSRIESEVFAFKRHVGELSDALLRLRGHIREVEIQAESQMQATFHTQGEAEGFDPLEFDRFTRFQEVTRFLAESVNDISTVQHILLARLGEADAALIQQTRLNRELQQDLLRVRMVPLYSVAERLYRTVRQTARDVDKRAQLDIQGGELEIDRSVLEKVTAPLEHLLRNALAHGIESPETRRAAGKAEFGEIVLTARQTGNEMLITVKDDGGGLNYARIREKAEANGLLLPGVEPTETLLAQMIFAAGFSTAENVTQVAGRGVGMDVVKSEISALGGRIDISSEAGVGTSFHIFLPLTLAMTQAVMIQAAKRDFALPAPLVRQVLELKPHELEEAMAAGEINWRGGKYPLSYLPHLLGETDAVHEVLRYNPVVLLASGSSQAAVLVDTIEGTREIVVKNIGPQMARITGVAGATVRGDGRVVLILNPVPLALRWASMPRSAAERAAPVAPVETRVEAQPPMVLVVDDSLTVRKITTRLLTREGFRVDSAKDGVDALEKMRDLIPDIVLLDVEMPRMDGFELARVMRADERMKSVPIIMITSRTADKHRNLAMEIGVNVYLGKPYQEHLLLEHIAEQLGQEVTQPA
jgi:chemosensory pili system protein ChpA (sensor histidine kinase/response regulator)